MPCRRQISLKADEASGYGVGEHARHMAVIVDQGAQPNPGALPTVRTSPALRSSPCAQGAEAVQP